VPVGHPLSPRRVATSIQIRVFIQSLLDLSVNYVDGQRHASERDDRRSQMVEGEEAAFQFLKAIGGLGCDSGSSRQCQALSLQRLQQSVLVACDELVARQRQPLEKAVARHGQTFAGPAVWAIRLVRRGEVEHEAQ